MMANFKQQGFAAVAVLGLIALVVLLGAVVYFNQSPTQTPTEQPTPSKNLTLILDSPTTNTQAVDDSILIKGKTLPKSVVVMFNDADELTLEADQNGYFQGKLLLTEGINTLTVTAFGEDGQEKSVKVDVTYSPNT